MLVIPVVITSFDSDMLNQSDKNKANIENIPVIARDDITGLIQLALDNSANSDVIEFITRRVPQRGDVVSFVSRQYPI